MLSNHPNVLGRGPTASSIGIGDVDGPASATDKAIARFNGTTGKLIQNSTVTLSDTTGVFTQTTVNGDITLTPNGTGGVVSNSTTNGLITVATSGQNHLIFRNASAPTTNVWINFLAANDLSWFRQGGSTKMVLATSGNLLLGGLTTDGTGVLQFPTATTSAGGITFGTDVSLYRKSASVLQVEATTGTGALRVLNTAGVGIVEMYHDGNPTISGTSGVLQLALSGTAVMAISSSTNARIIGTKTLSFGTDRASINVSADTTAGDLTISGTSTGSVVVDSQSGNFQLARGKLIGGTNNMVVTSGSGNSRTMTLQTTTSGGTATDALIISATQMLQLMGATSSFPAIARSGVNVRFRLADDSADTTAVALTYIASGAAVTAGAGAISYGGTTASTVGAAGGASALPATPSGYIIVNVAGTNMKVPYYAN